MEIEVADQPHVELQTCQRSSFTIHYLSELFGMDMGWVGSWPCTIVSLNFCTVFGASWQEASLVQSTYFAISFVPVCLFQLRYIEYR